MWSPQSGPRIFVGLVLLCGGACAPPDKPSHNTELLDYEGGQACTQAGGALVFARASHVTKHELTEVVLPDLAREEGVELVSPEVEVWGCDTSRGGSLIEDTDVRLCTPAHTVRGDKRGCFTSHSAPFDHTTQDDGFAEVNTYYHAQRVSRFFGRLGHAGLPATIPLVVNFQINTIQIWHPLNNAFYAGPGLGLPGIFTDLDRGAGMLVFGQGDKIDFSYDSTVVFHEYGHAVMGPERFVHPRTDGYGLDHLPTSLHEGMADLFTALLEGEPVVGPYALGHLYRLDFRRDLSFAFKCPDHIEGEPHADGQVPASALWAARGALGGNEATGKIVLNAVLSLGGDSGYDAFATALELITQRDSGALAAAELRSTLDAHGVRNCRRTAPLRSFMAVDGHAPLWVPGTLQAGLPAFDGGVPAPLQYEAQKAPEGQGIQIDFALQCVDLLGADTSSRIEVAWRKGNPVGYSYTPAAQRSADGVLRTAPSGDGYLAHRVEIHGPCVSQPLFFQVVNTGPYDAYIVAMTVRHVPSDGRTTPGCGS